MRGQKPLTLFSFVWRKRGAFLDKRIPIDETIEEKILAFEKEKEVTLPSKYKEWMLFSDGGELVLPAGVQLYGIEHTVKTM